MNNKLLPEPILTQICIIPQGHNELINHAGIAILYPVSGGTCPTPAEVREKMAALAQTHFIMHAGVKATVNATDGSTTEPSEEQLYGMPEPGGKILAGESGLYFNIDSLAPGRFQRNFRNVIFQLISVIHGSSISF